MQCCAYARSLSVASHTHTGTAVEFSKPGSFEPLTDMIGGGAFKLEPGQVTLVICLVNGYTIVAKIPAYMANADKVVW